MGCPTFPSSAYPAKDVYSNGHSRSSPIQVKDYQLPLNNSTLIPYKIYLRLTWPYLFRRWQNDLSQLSLLEVRLQNIPISLLPLMKHLQIMKTAKMK